MQTKDPKPIALQYESQRLASCSLVWSSHVGRKAPEETTSATKTIAFFLFCRLVLVLVVVVVVVIVVVVVVVVASVVSKTYNMDRIWMNAA